MHTPEAFYEAPKADLQDPVHLDKAFQAAMEAIERFSQAYLRRISR